MTAKPSPAPPSARVAEIPLASPPALVLFGRDDRGRPRVAWFEATDVEAATAAAVTMRLRALPLADDARRNLAKQGARGRLLPSGRALVPLAKHDLYARLVALAGNTAGLSVAEGGSSATPSENAPASAASTGTAMCKPGKGATMAIVPPPPASTGERPSTEAAKPVADAASPAPTARPGDRTFVGHPQPGDRGDIGLGSVVLAHEGPEDGWWEAEVIGINGPVFSLRWCDFQGDTFLRKAGELALLPPGEA